MTRLLPLMALFFGWYSWAQPGAQGGYLGLKVYKNGQLADLRSKDWQVIPKNIELTDATTQLSENTIWKHQAKADFYYIVPRSTPSGGAVWPDFHVALVHHQDTMYLYPPSIQYDPIELDSVVFQKGRYSIPLHLYQLKDLSKKTTTRYGKAPVPSIYGDWNRITHDTYKCYVEKTEDIESEATYAEHTAEMKQDWQKWPYLYIAEQNANYYFYNNTIVKYSYRTSELVVYEVKDYLDTHLFASGVPTVSSLFYKDKTVFAILNKENKIRGIYKLHFVEETPRKELAYLARKQAIEEYEASIKMTERIYKEDAHLRDKEKRAAKEKLDAFLNTLPK